MWPCSLCRQSTATHAMMYNVTVLIMPFNHHGQTMGRQTKINSDKGQKHSTSTPITQEDGYADNAS